MTRLFFLSSGSFSCTDLYFHVVHFNVQIVKASFLARHIYDFSIFKTAFDLQTTLAFQPIRSAHLYVLNVHWCTFGLIVYFDGLTS